MAGEYTQSDADFAKQYAQILAGLGVTSPTVGYEYQGRPYSFNLPEVGNVAAANAFTLPSTFNVNDVWKNATAANNYIPRWASKMVAKIPSMNAAQKQAVYDHWIGQKGMLPAFKNGPAMPGETQAQLIKLLGMQSASPTTQPLPAPPVYNPYPGQGFGS
jgi:hypothetical protein